MVLVDDMVLTGFRIIEQAPVDVRRAEVWSQALVCWSTVFLKIK